MSAIKPSSDTDASLLLRPLTGGLILKWIVHKDRILALGACGKKRHRGFDKLLQPLHIFDRLRRKIGPGARALRRFVPALQHFVNGLNLRPARRGPPGRWSSSCPFSR